MKQTDKNIGTMAHEAKDPNGVLDSVSISFIQELIDKYEDKVKSVENLKNQGGSTWGSESPLRESKERFDVRIYERNTFIKDLKSLLNEC